MKNNKRNNEIRVSKPKHKTKPSQTQQRNTQNVSSTTGRQGGTNRRTNGRKCTCNPAPLAAPFSPFPFRARQRRPLKLRTADCSLKPQSARQLGNLEFVAVAGAVEVDVAGSSTARQPESPTMDPLRWHCVCGAAGDFSTCRIVRSDKEPKCQYTWQRRCRNSS